LFIITHKNTNKPILPFPKHDSIFHCIIKSWSRSLISELNLISSPKDGDNGSILNSLNYNANNKTKNA